MFLMAGLNIHDNLVFYTIIMILNADLLISYFSKSQ